jgi:hypothetical protein
MISEIPVSMIYVVYTIKNDHGNYGSMRDTKKLKCPSAQDTWFRRLAIMLSGNSLVTSFQMTSFINFLAVFVPIMNHQTLPR